MGWMLQTAPPHYLLVGMHVCTGRDSHGQYDSKKMQRSDKVTAGTIAVSQRHTDLQPSVLLAGGQQGAQGERAGRAPCR